MKLYKTVQTSVLNIVTAKSYEAYQTPSSALNVYETSVESEMTGYPLSDMAARDIVTSESK